MRIPFKQLKKYVVETSSGTKLGHVLDVVLDTEGQLVVQYEVSPSILSSKKHLISRDQIVRFEEEKIVVDDSILRIRVETEEKKQVSTNAEPVMMREE